MFNIRKFLLSLITVFFSNQAFVQALLGVVLCDVCLVLHIVGTCGLMRIGSAKLRRRPQCCHQRSTTVHTFDDDRHWLGLVHSSTVLRFAGRPYSELSWNLFEGLSLIATTFTFHVALYAFTYRLDLYEEKDGGVFWNYVVAVATVIVNAVCVGALGYAAITALCQISAVLCMSSLTDAVLLTVAGIPHRHW